MKLSDYLKESGKTREEFADEVGVSRQTIQSILVGRTHPGLELAFAIEKATDRLVKAESWVKR